MKKTILFSFLLAAGFNQATAAIVYTNNADQVLTSGGTISVDFNNDGTAEFDFQDMGFGSTPEPGVLFASANHHLTTVSTTEWDVMKGLAAGTLINASAGFFDQGDAYINPAWGTTPFTVGDAYLGAKFNLGSSTYYGWILVNLSGNGVFTIKSFAYESTANTAILAGATSSAGISEPIAAQFNIVPNPATTAFEVHTSLSTNGVIEIYSLLGKLEQRTEVSSITQSISIAQLPVGTYLVRCTAGAHTEDHLVVKVAP
jgi:hypothetical protein